MLQQSIPDSLREPANLTRLCRSAITTLAVLHDIDWTELKLPGRPTGIWLSANTNSAPTVRLVQRRRKALPARSGLSVSPCNCVP